MGIVLDATCIVTRIFGMRQTIVISVVDMVRNVM